MKRTQEILMMLVLTTSLSVTAQTSMPSISVRVDCAAGQSLNRTLAKLDKHAAATVSVNGTCTEYVQVIGFENLTLMDPKQEAFCDEHAEGEMIELQKPGLFTLTRWDGTEVDSTVNQLTNEPLEDGCSLKRTKYDSLAARTGAEADSCEEL